MKRACLKKLWQRRAGALMRRSGILLIVLALLIISVTGSLWRWWTAILTWLASPVAGAPREAGFVSNGEALRNLALVLAALIGLPLAIWRSWVAERQTRAAQRQVKMAERSLLHERYQRSAGMLGSHALATRIGGIYALGRIAAEHTDEYHFQIMDTLCAIIRNPRDTSARESIDEGVQEDSPVLPPAPRCPPDIEAAATVIGYRNAAQLKLDRQKNKAKSETKQITQWPDLRGADLRSAMLTEADFSGADLSCADLSEARLASSNLSGANLNGANLSYGVFMHADFSGAEMFGANLTGAILVGATGVTQSMMSHVSAEEGEEPILDATRCAMTGKRLVWEGVALQNGIPKTLRQRMKNP